MFTETYKIEHNINIKPIVLEKINFLKSLCKKYNVAYLYLFGSATSDRFNENSDLDFLVAFDNVPIFDYADYFFDFMHELEDLYGRKIDLLTEQSLTNPYLIKSINRNKQLIYDRRNQEVFA